MRLVSLVLAVLLAPAVLAQEADTLAAADGWRSSLVATLAGNQSSFSNWQEGGVDALAATASVDGTFDRVVGRVFTAQSLRLAYGVLRQDTLEMRKAVDVARYELAAELKTSKALRPALGFSARTQFAPGYDYSPEVGEYPSLVIVPGEPLQVSGPLAPLVLGQTIGAAYRPAQGVVGRLGLGLKETVVTIERFRPVFGNALDEAVRVEAGLDAAISIDRQVMENVTLRSSLTAFESFSGFDEAPDVLFENALLLTVNDFLNVRLAADALYDADVSQDVQLRETLSVGLTLALL
ncbi:DUF3078 domain-containing protein [Rubrivirga sp. IMCC43871]|uniref:DUF3078 domain-containing protein n=1 Tax=Rubrivirga sp. IMCC43871 TaxID=3391575 RepID=UPI00398F9127